MRISRTKKKWACSCEAIKGWFLIFLGLPLIAAGGLGILFIICGLFKLREARLENAKVHHYCRDCGTEIGSVYMN